HYFTEARTMLLNEEQGGDSTPIVGGRAPRADVNHYTYVRNDPMDLTDPTGMTALEATHGAPSSSFVDGMVNSLLSQPSPGSSLNLSLSNFTSPYAGTFLEKMQSSTAADLIYNGMKSSPTGALDRDLAFSVPLNGPD